MSARRGGPRHSARLAAIACGLVACTWASAGQAAWEFTDWGMTVEQVVAASAGSASPVEDERDTRIWDQRRLAKGTITRDGIEYQVGYYFDKRRKRLTLVDLNFPAEHCDATLAGLEARLGKGVPETRAAGADGSPLRFAAVITKWGSSGSEERVHFVDIKMREGDYRFCKVLAMEREIDAD